MKSEHLEKLAAELDCFTSYMIEPFDEEVALHWFRKMSWKADELVLMNRSINSK